MAEKSTWRRQMARANNWSAALLWGLIGWGAGGCGELLPSGKEGLGLGGEEDYMLQIDGDTAAYSPQRLFKSEQGADAAADADLTKISFEFPRFEGSTLSATVRDSLNATIQQYLLLNESGELAYEGLEARMNDFIQQYEEDKAMSAGLGWGADNKWSCEVAIRVLANTPRLVSLRMDEVNFTGGAHNNVQTRYLNFDAKTGKRLFIQDMISVEIEQLLPVAERWFRQKAKIPDNVPLTETEYEFLSGDFELPEQVGVTRKSLIFQYDPYQLGSPDPFVFEVPLKDVAALLNKKIMY